MWPSLRCGILNDSSLFLSTREKKLECKLRLQINTHQKLCRLSHLRNSNLFVLDIESYLHTFNIKRMRKVNRDLSKMVGLRNLILYCGAMAQNYVAKDLTKPGEFTAEIEGACTDKNGNIYAVSHAWKSELFFAKISLNYLLRLFICSWVSKHVQFWS